MKAILTPLILMLCLTCIYAQPGVRYHDDRAMDGFTLYQSSNQAVLVNNCGELINNWTEIGAHLWITR